MAHWQHWEAQGVFGRLSASVGKERRRKEEGEKGDRACLVYFQTIGLGMSVIEAAELGQKTHLGTTGEARKHKSHNRHKARDATRRYYSRAGVDDCNLRLGASAQARCCLSPSPSLAIAVIDLPHPDMQRRGVGSPTESLQASFRRPEGSRQQAARSKRARREESKRRIIAATGRISVVSIYDRVCIKSRDKPRLL